MNFRNLLVFYSLLSLPLLCLIVLSKTHQINAVIFVVGLLTWGLVYHPFICGLRLLQSKRIKSSEFMLNFIPFWNLKHFRFLFFNKE